jgi:hypothetical protein
VSNRAATFDAILLTVFFWKSPLSVERRRPTVTPRFLGCQQYFARFLQTTIVGLFSLPSLADRSFSLLASREAIGALYSPSGPFDKNDAFVLALVANGIASALSMRSSTVGAMKRDVSQSRDDQDLRPAFLGSSRGMVSLFPNHTHFAIALQKTLPYAPNVLHPLFAQLLQ